MAALQHLPADSSPEAIASLLDADGALILDDVIGAAEIALSVAAGMVAALGRERA